MSLFHLMYVSIASWPMSDDDLKELIAKSRSRNADDGITGVLVYGSGRFLHILEGDNAKVYDLFNRICRDERHCGVSILMSRPASERVFPEWGMTMLNLAAPMSEHDPMLRARLRPEELTQRGLDAEFVATIECFIAQAHSAATTVLEQTRAISQQPTGAQ